MQSSVTFIVQVAVVALTVIAIRWLFAAEGAQQPRNRDGTSVYGIKWQWRTVGLGGGAFWVLLSIWAWHDAHAWPGGGLISITAAFIVLGGWLASGSITTDQTGITKKILWHSRSFPWKDITEIRLHKKQGGAIELRSGSRKLVIDSRFNAFQHLINEIEEHTQLKPTSRSSSG